MKTLDLENALDIAIKAVDAAEQTIQAHQSSGDWSVSYKMDDSPVTEVDIATEKAIKAALMEQLPEADFYGEETGRTSAVASAESGLAESSRFAANQFESMLWLVDPIDGTKSFIRNMRYFSTQIALQIGTELCVGVSNAPAYGERMVARRGNGAWLNGTQVHCRNTSTLSEAFLSTGNLDRMARNAASWDTLGQIIQQVRRVRGYGDFCHYHQLCCGQTDLIIESDVNILDIAALTVAVREAGGVITDLGGRAVSLETRSVLAAGTAALHAEVLALIAPSWNETVSV